MRASEEPHRVETVLANNLANAYTNYKNNLDALEYYRGFILPDQIRAFRGVHDRREADPNVAFADIVTAQQTLVTNVQAYLTILGQIWTSVISVADLLQTDDLFQLSQPRAVPPLPDLEDLPPLACNHNCVADCSTPGSEAGKTIMAAAPTAKDGSIGTPVATLQPAATTNLLAGKQSSELTSAKTEEPLARAHGSLPPAPFAPGFGVPRLGFSAAPGSILVTPP
jgi:hypothetical protein